MAYSSCILLLLRLLIGGISTNLPQVHARPNNFWCNSVARKNMSVAEKVECNKTDVLPSPVLMPSVELNLNEWENKTLQQKQAEILEALQLFDLVINNETSLQCMRTLRIKNYMIIVKKAPIQKDNLTPPHHPQKTKEGKTIGEVLDQYKTLIKKKLNLFAQDLQLSNCKRKK
ncbi:uncharacterized protein LOC144996833 isoform X2 [Oryzias latipes]